MFDALTASMALLTAIDFEWSPGRGDDRYLGNRSAFDVVIQHTTHEGGRGFIGVEVKYHENLRGQPATLRDRAVEVADRAGIPDDRSDIERLPLQQIWLDHLLALSILQADDGYASGLFVFLHPTGNGPCATAADRYRSMLTDQSTFERLTLETVVAAIRWATDAPWIDAFESRYLLGSCRP